MCGIFGLYNYKISSANKILKYFYNRGPDQSNLKFFLNKKFVLGHTRLSIIDKSTLSNQPMSSKKKKIHLVYNGEIYNYKLLKKKLIDRGHYFNTNSDTEVVLKSYIEWGSQCFNYFRGMFAIAIFDENLSSCFLSRDNFGIKPLIYFLSKESFFFGSEIIPLIKDNNLLKKLNKETINYYLDYGSVKQPQSFFKNINYVNPGDIIRINLKNLKVVKLNTKKEFFIQKKIISKKKLVNKIYEAINSSVKNHLMASEKVGCLLSGGLDSSIISYLATNNLKYQMNTYCLGDFNNKAVDESSKAEKFANLIRSKHKTFYIQDFNILSEFEQFIEKLDQPSCDGFNTFLITKAINKETRVVLSGLGADELFGGYNFYNLILKNRMNFIQGKIFDFINKIRPNRITQNSVYREQTPEKIISIFRNFRNHKEKYINKNLDINKSKNSKLVASAKYEFENYLLNTILRDVDNLSMSNSIEVRVPFIDKQIVNLAVSIPDNLKIYNNITKYILRKSFKEKIPIEFLSEKKKGFELSYENILNNELNKLYLDKLSSSYIRNFLIGYMNRFEFKKLFKRVQKKNSIRFDWNIFILICWLTKNKLI